MALFKQSLGEFSWDRFTHPWTVVLFLVLSLVTFIISLTLPAGEDTGSAADTHVGDLDVTCWLSPRLSGGQMVYASKVCQADVEKILRGEKNVDNIFTTKTGYSYEPITWIPKHLINKTIDGQNSTANKGDESKEKEPSFMLITSQNLPLMLFVFAVLVKLPQLVFQQLATSCTTFNMEKTLKSAVNAQCKKPGEKERCLEELAASIDTRVRASPSSASKNFICYKCFTFLIIFILTIYLAVVRSPETPSDNSISNKDKVYMSDDVLCMISIQQLQNVASNTYQCQVEYSLQSPAPAQEDWVNHLLTGLMTYFVVSSVVNLVSLLVFLARLLCGQCDVSPPKSFVPMDVRLLLLLSQANAGPDVTQYLISSTSGRTGNGEPESHGLNMI